MVAEAATTVVAEAETMAAVEITTTSIKPPFAR
jgi:hypothetical protein